MGGETSELHSRSAFAEQARLNEKKSGFFQVPQASIESIRSKLAFKIFDDANILKGMYSMKFNGITADGGTSTRTPSDPGGPAPPLHLPSSSPSRPGNLMGSRKQKAGGGIEGSN